MSPVNPINISSELRRPIFKPKESTPFAASPRGMDGLPTRPPLLGSPRSSNPSLSSFLKMTETVCEDKPAMRERSLPGIGPFLSNKDSRRRSL